MTATLATPSNLPSLDFKGVFSVGTSITIDAPIEKVWSILLDFPCYHEWNPFVRAQTVVDPTTELPLPDQTPFPGLLLHMSPIHIPARMSTAPASHTHSTDVLITAVDTVNQRLAWRLHGPPRWVLQSERWQALSLTRDGRTRYETVEVFGGIGAYAVKLWVGEGLEGAFKAMAEGLKTRAED